MEDQLEEDEEFNIMGDLQDAIDKDPTATVDWEKSFNYRLPMHYIGRFLLTKTSRVSKYSINFRKKN